MKSELLEIPTYDDVTHELNVVIETPRGSRVKFKYEERTGQMTVDKVLPNALFFSFNFGFAPLTLAEDGDPLDILLLMDETTFCCCLLRARVIGSIDAEQKEKDGAVHRSDRIFAVALASRIHSKLTSIEQVDSLFDSRN